MPDRERFSLTTQNAGDRHGIPIAPRLRRLLKVMLRGYGIRCITILPVGSTRTIPQPPRKEGES